MTFFGRVSIFCTSNCLCKTKLGKGNTTMKLSFYGNSCRLFLVSVNNIIYKQISKIFRLRRLITRYFNFIFFSLLMTSPLQAGSSGGLYDMSKLLAASHPFSKKNQALTNKTKKTTIRIEKIGSIQEPPTLQTYTGENTVEISCHGSTYIQSSIIQLLIKNGCRLAKKGEFTLRAFLNGLVIFLKKLPKPYFLLPV